MIAIMGYMAGFALRIMGALLGLHIAGFLLVAALRRSTTAWIRNARKVKVAVPHPWASECEWARYWVPMGRCVGSEVVCSVAAGAVPMATQAACGSSGARAVHMSGGPSLVPTWATL